MKIKSSKDKTRHILVRVTPYAPFGEEDEFIGYGFLYFNFSPYLEEELVSFQKNWKNGSCKISRYPIKLREAILIESSAVENNDNSESDDYKFIKFDALNHLEDEPIFDDCDKYYKIQGMLLCYLDYFEIQIERIPDGEIVPSVIFRTRDYYSKLSDKIL